MSDTSESKGSILPVKALRCSELVAFRGGSVVSRTTRLCCGKYLLRADFMRIGAEIFRNR